jgi:glycerol kinase
MLARFVAAIDHGTTSTRCILFDPNGTPAAIAQRDQTMYYPRPGWVELDMEQVWERTRECIHEALAAAGAVAADVAAIGIANERESVVLWDRRTGRPVAPSITWQDTRTAAEADALAADGGINRFQRTTGLPISTYCPPSSSDGCSTRTPPGVQQRSAATSCSERQIRGCCGT